MSYATKQHMIDRFGEDHLIQLTDRAATPTGEIDDTVLQAALDAADQEIDSLVAVRYKVPLNPVPELIKSYACDIARHKLHRFEPPEGVIKEKDAAMKALREIGSGIRVLNADGVEPAAPAVTTAPAVTGPERVFSRDNLKGY